MWLTVEHTTRFSYDDPINEAYTEMRLKPAHRDGQRCSSFTLATEPRGASVRGAPRPVRQRRASLRRARVASDARRHRAQRGVDAEQFVDDEAAPSPLDRCDLLRPSRYVPLDGAIAELAATIDAGRAVGSRPHTP